MQLKEIVLKSAHELTNIKESGKIIKKQMRRKNYATSETERKIA